MSDIDEQLRVAEEKGLVALQAASTLEELDAARTAHLGKRSPLSQVQRQLGGMDDDARRTVGAAVNDVRGRLTEAEAARRAILTDERDRVVLAAEAIDVTLPLRVPPRGTLHPVQETMEALLDILVGLGYRVAEGPQVETEWFNFDALNTPPDHPARSLQDTIYVRPPGADQEDPEEATRTRPDPALPALADRDATRTRPDPALPALADRDATRTRPDPALADRDTTGLLLRTHTSPMQIRTMLVEEPPFYVAIPGRVYRADTMDATHLPMFHQMEGLAIDTDLSFADLKGSLTVAARALLGEDVHLRFRPHFFPFTEPSCELDAWFDPDGPSAPGTPHGRWMELLGAGMVHPNVLRAGGLDPEVHRGFAWGMGVDRMAMLRHGISDMRLLVENDLRFLSSL
jgi:phenylalanyl-tRNA synthetase alpha chain